MPELFPKLQAMESRRWFEELREAFLALHPIKFATINDDACRIRARDAEPLGGGCDDNVCSVVNRAKKKATCSGSVISVGVVSGLSSYGRCPDIHNQRNACLMSYSGYNLDVRHEKLGA